MKRTHVIAPQFLLIIIQTVGSRVTFRHHSDWINGLPLIERHWWEQRVFSSYFNVFFHLVLWCEGVSVRNLMLSKSQLQSSCHWGFTLKCRERARFAVLVFLQVGSRFQFVLAEVQPDPEESPHRESVTEVCVRRFMRWDHLLWDTPWMIESGVVCCNIKTRRRNTGVDCWVRICSKLKGAPVTVPLTPLQC